MSDDSWLSKISSGSEHVVQDVMAQVDWGRLRQSGGVSAIARLGNELAANVVLSKRAQARRLQAILVALRIPEGEFDSLTEVAREFPSHLRLTVAEWLPASSRHGIYGRVEHDSPPAGKETQTAEVRPQLPDKSIVSEHGSDEDTEAKASEGPAFSTVLLLSHPDHQEANKVLLASQKLDPVVVANPEALNQLLTSSTEVCAFAIDESFLSLLEGSQQRELIQTLGAYSTFAAVRIDDTGLRLATDEVAQLIKETRRLAAEVPHDVLTFQPEGTIREAELGWFRRSAELLRSREQDVTFIFGDISPAEAHLLAAAVRRRLESESIEAVELPPIEIRFLPSGRSGARLATIKCGESRTFVAKLAPKEHARDEIYRFRIYMQGWEEHLHPDCHFHGDSAVILSALVRSGTTPGLPARPLETALIDLWNAQWMRHNSNTVERQGDLVSLALERAATELARLNARAPTRVGVPAFVDPPITHLTDLESDGFDYGLGETAAAARRKATARYRRLKGTAVVHGDLHLRNVLLRGDTDVQLIDFAAAGPGHPAIDLVRFELALYLVPVRQFESYEACVDFQRALTIDRMDIEGLRDRFPTFFRCHVNGSCARGMVAARDKAIEVVRGHSGDPRDYLSVKFLVAWQNQGIIGMNPGLARAVVDALAPELQTW